MKENALYANAITIPNLHGLFSRPRLNDLLGKAISSPLVIVTAGAGYGKTQAVSEYLDKHPNIVPIWLRLSKLDNLTTRFWESFICAVDVQNAQLASSLYAIGFPNALSIFDLFLHVLADSLEDIEHLVLVFDDFHLIRELPIINFVENLLSARLKNLSIILIGRSEPQLYLHGFLTENLIYKITEADLCFTLEETKGYLNMQGIVLHDNALQEIYMGTGGWIVALYLVSLSLTKKKVMVNQAFAEAKPKIFELIEREIFVEYTPVVQKLLVELSFLDSTSIDSQIVRSLSDNSVNLIGEIEKTNPFIHYDPLTKSYYIHHLFLEFLSTRQEYCTEEEIEKIHCSAAQWYYMQGSVIDALEYYQKCGHYDEIWNIIRRYDIDIPQEVANLFLELIDEFPEVLLNKYPLIGVIRGRLLLNNGRLEESVNELTIIKETFEALPTTPENRAVIGEACIFLAMLSLSMRNYDFVELFKTADQCLPDGSEFVDNSLYLNNGNYSVVIESPAAGEVEKFKKAAMCAMPYAARAMNGCCYGMEYLIITEADYYTGDVKKAEANAYKAIYRASRQKQNDTVCIAYFTLMRTSIAKGNYPKAAGFLELLREKVEKPNSIDCLNIIGVIKGWLYSRLSDIDKIPDWIMEEDRSSKILSPNRIGRERLIRAYCFLENGNYYELIAFLEYLEDIYEYKSFLIPKLQVQIYKSIAALKIQNVPLSMTALKSAYNLAYANSIIMPFIEMGKYMRIVCNEAKRHEDISIPGNWLDMIYTKASTYAKHLHNVQAEYRFSTGSTEKKPYNLTSRENDVLIYLCQGLTRKEIADSLYISMSTVKRVLKDIYIKMGASNSTEAVNLAIKAGLDKRYD